MATRQIVADAYELHVLLLGTLNLAAASLQAGDMQTTGVALARAGELYPALKEAMQIHGVFPGSMPKPANGAAEGKRA